MLQAKQAASIKSVLRKGQTPFKNKTTKKQTIREQNAVFPILKLSRLHTKFIAFTWGCVPSYESAAFPHLNENDSCTNKMIPESNTEALATT